MEFRKYIGSRGERATESAPQPSRAKLVLKQLGLQFEEAINRIGSSGTVFDEHSATTPLPKELLALAPVSMPEPGAGRLLYNIAYGPSQGSHPFRGITQALFNGKGFIPSEAHNEDAPIRLSGMIETSKSGNITSTPIFDAFNRQAAYVKMSQEPRKPSSVTLGSLQLKRAYR